VDVDGTVVRGEHQKYCTDCGKLILARAEICPECGCRQLPIQSAVSSYGVPKLRVDPAAGPMILLLVLNILWSGLGNIAIGDKRGWGFGFFNWVCFVASFFFFGVPCILFFAYCGFKGYQYLQLCNSSSNLNPAEMSAPSS
jgi:hypothetical protein